MLLFNFSGQPVPPEDSHRFSKIVSVPVPDVNIGDPEAVVSAAKGLLDAAIKKARKNGVELGAFTAEDG
jgi:hypothetical protein